MSTRYNPDSAVAEVSYDPAIIQKFADKMYARARAMIFAYTFVGLVAGGFGGYASANPMQHVPFTLFGAAIGGCIGYLIAEARAFQFRLQAQMALCQMAIEQNTRVRLGAVPGKNA